MKLPHTISALVVAASAVLAQAPTPPAPVAPPSAPLDKPAVIEPAVPAKPADATSNVPADPKATNPGAPAAPTAIEPPVQAPGTPQNAVPPPGNLDTTTTSDPNVKRPVEFNGDQIDLVLRTLARQARINVVVSPKVQETKATVNMRLEDKTPREVIDIICQANGLFVDELNHVVYIKTADEKAAEPTESMSYTFSYAQAKDVQTLLVSQIGGSEKGASAPQVDTRTNTIFYRVGKSNIDHVQKFLESVDRPTQQVMIEARLVEVNANPKQSYGINWGGVVGNSSTPQTFKYGGSGATADGDPPTKIVVDKDTGKLKPSDLFLAGRGANFGSLLGGQFAILSVPQMSATVRFLNEDSDAEFLANPRIVAANNQKATIKITRAQPVPQLNFNEQTAQAVFSGFQDKEFGNSLVVTPIINKDQFVSLTVQPEISNKVGDATFSFGGATVASPIIDKRTFDSNVLIKSGDTLAIGGLLQDEVSKGRNKVPGLGDVPLLGYFFQERLNSRTKRNLLVFVTPTIIKQGYGTGLENQAGGLSSVGEEYADPNGWRNNARGAVRVVPTSNRQVAADYPAPGIAPAPRKVNRTAH